MNSLDCYASWVVGQFEFPQCVGQLPLLLSLLRRILYKLGRKVEWSFQLVQAARDDFRVRQATPGDTFWLCQILNKIIAIGGTTAIETPLSLAEFEDHFLIGRDCIICFVAEASNGELAGFQSLTRNSELPKAWADIATFTRREPRIAGVGTALFQSTITFARHYGIVVINATIRADNYSGLPYYEKMGFETYTVASGIPLKNGMLVDRISKKYCLN
jgi:GNAT superfamily N-acetyltransferase